MSPMPGCAPYLSKVWTASAFPSIAASDRAVRPYYNENMSLTRSTEKYIADIGGWGLNTVGEGDKDSDGCGKGEGETGIYLLH